jgi:hypothetical protein
MTFSFATVLTAILGGGTLSVVLAAPIETCGQQADCVQFSLHKITDDSICEDDCYYNICMKIALDADGCVKDAADTISHSCIKDPVSCSDETALGFAGTLEENSVPNGYVQCQKVPVGGKAEFLLKDGRAADSCGTASVSFLSDCTANCETYPVQSCTGRGNIGLECVWTVDAPEDCNKSGGGFGDPHIKRWDQKRFDFHGECDLVLLHSDTVDGNMPLDLHIRTSIQGHFSFIETAALKVGDIVFQLDADKFFVNGQEFTDDAVLPMVLEEFVLEPVEFDGPAKLYTVLLSDKSTIKFKAIKKFLSVSVSGHEEDFSNSTGLMGDYDTGSALSRDGHLMEDDFIAYGMEWQVLETEPKLFQELRDPQLPYGQCLMPTEDATASRRRLLRSSSGTALWNLATEACSVKEEFESCMEDIMTTGDVDLALAWY